VEEEDQTLEEEDRILEEEDKTLEEEGLTLEEKGRTLEEEGRTLEEEGRTLEDEREQTDGEDQCSKISEGNKENQDPKKAKNKTKRRCHGKKVPLPVLIYQLITYIEHVCRGMMKDLGV